MPRVFMSWGGLLPSIWLSSGKLPAYQAADLPALLCQQRPLKLIFLGNDADASGAAFLAELGLAASPPTLTTAAMNSWQIAEFTLPPQPQRPGACR